MNSPLPDLAPSSTVGHGTLRPSRLSRRGIEWLLLALIILAVGFVRFRLLNLPLERDEGEYAYMGQQILKGIPLYGQAYDIKLPGTYMMYALLMAFFGQSTLGIHLGLLLVNSITTVLIYFLGRRIAGGFTGIIASAAYAVLSLSSSTLGFATHATHFIVLPVIGASLLLLRAMQDSRRLRWYLWSGVVSGMALIMKQAALFLIVFLASYIIVEYFSTKPPGPRKKVSLEIVSFIFGSSIPLLVTLLWLYASGTFSKFWFWAVTYAWTFGSQVPLSGAFEVFTSIFPRAVDGFSLVWILGFLGILSLPFTRLSKGEKPFLLLFALFSFLSVCPGFHFHRHYFVLLLPAVSLLAGTFVSFLRSTALKNIRPPALSTALSAGVFLAALGTGLISQRDYFFGNDLRKIMREAYGINPFPESVPVADFIASKSEPGDKIAVLGSEPQIYFYSGRQSATPYIDMYNLMIHQPDALAMQQEMIAGIESAKPKFIVYASARVSWLPQQNSEQHIFEWMQGYLWDHYSTVGVADVISPDSTECRWEENAAAYEVKGPSALIVFQRK